MLEFRKLEVDSMRASSFLRRSTVFTLVMSSDFLTGIYLLFTTTSSSLESLFLLGGVMGKTQDILQPADPEGETS